MNKRVNVTRFSHHISARNDLEMIELMDKHGFTGYAVYFMLLEIIFASGHAVLPIGQPGVLKRIARDIGMETDELQNLIQDMVIAGLFDRDVYSEEEGLTNRLIAEDIEYIVTRRKIAKMGADARWKSKR